MSAYVDLADVAAQHAPPDRVERAENPAFVAYHEAAISWTRVTRSFVRSLHAFRVVARERTRRLARAGRDVEDRLHSMVADAPSAPPAPSAVPAASHADPCAQPVSAPALSARPLTARQMEIAALIARGLSNEQIAQELVLTPGTVGNHIGHILRRLGARNRAQVAAWIAQGSIHHDARDGLAP
jgi:DNA-binding CsgD family transcriptional regulator